MKTSGRVGSVWVRTRNGHRDAALILAVGAVLTAAGCTTSDSPDDNLPTQSAPLATKSATTPPDPTEKAKQDAIATYKAYWQEMEKLYADKSGKGANLKQFAASAALSNAELDAKRAHERGRLHVGEVGVGNPTATKTDINRKIPHVILSSCLDISRWQVVEVSTKKPVTLPTSRLTKYVIKSTLERWPEGWRVIRDEPQGKSC
ncbi:hypothetical protein ACGFYP_33725 [Streptomyces sp. NPDC048370]|uniref:hypothetical protein n=1 Tax=Streptomyces sp. NPDC048370 TaxID=3365540 RepID=UPI003718B0E7